MLAITKERVTMQSSSGHQPPALAGLWLGAALMGCLGKPPKAFADRGCTQQDVDFATSDSEYVDQPTPRRIATIPVVTIATLQGPTDLGDAVFLDAVVRQWHGCAWDSCPDDAPCQPCAEYLIVVDPPGVADPRSLLLQTSGEGFRIGRGYRFLLALSDKYRERLGVLAMTGDSPAALVVCAGPR